MARRLRFNGTDSKNGGCPAIHDDLDSGEIIVPVHLPAQDFWIFDSRLVAVLRFDDDEVLGDVEIITEPATVLGYCQARDAAVHASVAADEFAAQLGTKG
ncbi:DUF6879 family protein [Streptomyces sp. NPDC053720]|uniref:DUF6879 family protein n=1 Tax=Streptomyces sp. NPDC053720 TaxID=3154855 RepID=UPI0034130DB2